MSMITTVLIVACLFVIGQVGNAWDVDTCRDYKGEIISLKVENCPDETAEYCVMNYQEEIKYEITFSAGKSYKDTWTGYRFANSAGSQNLCELQEDMCQGEEGDEKTYSHKFNIPLRAPYDTVGKLQLITEEKALGAVEHGDSVIACAEIPVKLLADTKHHDYYNFQ